MKLNNIFIKNLLLEGKGDGKGCLMLYFKSKIKNWDEIINMIDPADLYNDESGTYGIEDKPHVTILYGFDPNVTSVEVKDLFKNVKQNIKVKIIGIDIFETKGKPYDVVKFTVESEQLNDLHNLSKELPHELTFNDYKPHMTIAYVKKGEGKKYVKKLENPIEIEGNDLVYSDSQRNTDEWKIKKSYKYTVPLNENTYPSRVLTKDEVKKVKDYIFKKYNY